MSKIKNKWGKGIEGSLDFQLIRGSKFEVLVSFENLDANGGKWNLWTSKFLGDFTIFSNNVNLFF